MDDKDLSFEALLRSRSIMPPRDGMAARIIAQAQTTPQRTRLSFGVWFQRCFEDFHLPRPAFALALLLLIGFFTGLGLPTSLAQNDAGGAVSQPLSLQDLLYPDEDELL